MDRKSRYVGNDVIVAALRGPGGQTGRGGGMVSLITDKLGRQTLQDVDRQPLLPEVLTSIELNSLPCRRTASVGVSGGRGVMNNVDEIFYMFPGYKLYPLVFGYQILVRDTCIRLHVHVSGVNAALDCSSPFMQCIQYIDSLKCAEFTVCTATVRLLSRKKSINIGS